MTESDFEQHVIDAFVAQAHHWGYVHVCRVESREKSPGIPDLNVCVDGEEVWMELKFVHDGRKPSIRPAQVRWIERRIAAGGKVVILTYIKGKVLIHAGEIARALAKQPLKWWIETAKIVEENLANEIMNFVDTMWR